MAYMGRKGASAPITSADIPDDSITAAKIVAGAVVADIANDTIDSQHYVAASIDNEHLADDAVGSDELAPDIALTGGSVLIPSVTTANLPGTGGGTYAAQTATNGMLVYNSTLGSLQQRASGIWSGIITAPIITSFQYSDGASATAEKTVVGLVSVSCTTQTSTTVLVPGASLGIQVGQRVTGTGIPLGATVVSVIEDTSFVLSSAATASATVTLTFGGVVTITGTNFDSILAGASANVGVTFDGTSATSISVNSIKTIITCTPPAHAAGTIILQVINASGLTAETDFIYDEEAIFTTAAGSLGSFPDATYTANADAPRIQATDGEGSPSALTTGFERVTSAFDDTVITTTIQGLTVLTSGYLTGTLSATEGTTYPFYATAKDSQNQRTAPRLFNIISRHPYPTGGTLDESVSGFRIHTYVLSQTGEYFTSLDSRNVDYLVVAGGGGGGSHNASGGGAGGLLYVTSYAVTAQVYTITVGDGGAGGSNSIGVVGQDSVITPASGSVITADGGGYGGSNSGSGGWQGGAGGSGGGALGARTVGQGNIGGENANHGDAGGGAGAEGNDGTPPDGGDGVTNSIDGTSRYYAGGGGGSAYSAQAGAGGLGGGGGGSSRSGSEGTGGAGAGVRNAGQDGTLNGAGGNGGEETGGGGGGANGSGVTGGIGGSGIVIIRYAV